MRSFLQVTAKITYRNPGGTHKKVVSLPLHVLVQCAMKPAGIFVQSTEGNLEYHKGLVEELTRYVVEQREFPGKTFEETVDLLKEAVSQVQLCETALKHFVEEQPLPWFLMDDVTAFEVEVDQ